ncbi:MAG: GGDEF domain-containing protein, partial [Eubacteriales bacterium]
SSQLAIIASLDTAAGLYNRSKCQEIFNNTSPATSGQKPAVVVIDLNDLKKINDQQGHRVGDELIITFARILQKASSIYPVKPFLGRYGGDEFVVYLTNVENDDLIDKFMTELSRLTAEFNQTETKKFTVSYACGYAINKDGAEGLSTRQLFDEADEEMYKNKRDMKKKLEESKQTETEGS